MIPAGGDRVGDVAPGAQQLLGFCDEVVEVQHVAVRQPDGVFAVQARVLRRQPVILGAGATPSVPTRWLIRAMRQNVFPAPGPAITRTGPGGASMASRCRGSGSRAMPGIYRFPILPTRTREASR